MPKEIGGIPRLIKEMRWRKRGPNEKPKGKWGIGEAPIQDRKGLKRNWFKMTVLWKALSINLRSYAVKDWGVLTGLGTLVANSLCYLAWKKGTTRSCHKLHFISSSRLWIHQVNAYKYRHQIRGWVRRSISPSYHTYNNSMSRLITMEGSHMHGDENLEIPTSRIEGYAMKHSVWFFFEPFWERFPSKQLVFEIGSGAGLWFLGYWDAGVFQLCGAWRDG